MAMAEWLDQWMQRAPLLPGDRPRDLLDRVEDLGEALDEALDEAEE
ncbi:hypothetical protein [Streptomyces brasiliscabiei]|nr:hypothetical protein [Streptomyces brasiliscabiei]